MLLDTNLSSYPLHQFLKEQEHEVFVVGGNPADYLANVSRNYIKQDYSDKARIVELIKKLKIDYLVPGCNDFSYTVCAELSEQFGFSGIDPVYTTHLINNKQLFRRFAQENDIPIPALITDEDVAQHLPVIVKPVDSYSGRGITIVRDSDDKVLSSAINTAKKQSRSGQYLVEQYMDGQLMSHSAFLKDHKIILDFFVEEQCIANPFAVDTSQVITDLPSTVVQNIRDVIERMAGLLKLTDGLFHTQFIMMGTDFRLVEVTRRCPGDLYSLLIEYSTGYHYAAMYTRPFLDTIPAVIGKPNSYFIVRHTMTVKKETRFTTVEFNKPVEQKGLFFCAKSGDQIDKAPLGRVGILFIKSSNQHEQQTNYNDLIRRNLYVIK